MTNTYRVTCTIEVHVEADSHEEAEAIGIEDLCWTNALIETEEVAGGDDD